jgi:KDO2-lipid IV(A) lauroyltransferase
MDLYEFIEKYGDKKTSRKKTLARRIRIRVRLMVGQIMEKFSPALILLFRTMPLGFSLMVARLGGRFWYGLVSPCRNLGLSNLDLAFGDSLSRREKADICRKSFQNVLIQMMLFYHYSFLSSEERAAFLDNPEELGKLTRLADSGRGALVLSAHLGNWELMNSYLAENNDLYFISRKDKVFDRYVTDCRNKYGVKTMHDKRSLSRKITGELKEGAFVVTVYDRNVGRTKGITEKFFGKDVFAPYHPVNIAVYSGVPVAAVFLVRTRKGYRLIVEGPIEIEPLDTRLKTYRRYIPKFLGFIEKYIRLYPEQWYWAHKRWGKPRGWVRTDEDLSGGFEI